MSTTSYFGRLFLELTERIKTEVPEIRWIDQDLGQLENYEDRPAVTFPCLLLDIAAASYEELANLAQTGNLMIVARLGFAPYGKSYVAAPDDVREKAVAYYEIEQKVFMVIQGWATDYTTPLIRTGAETERRTDTYRVRVLTFSTSYDDFSCAPGNSKVAADLKIDPELL